MENKILNELTADELVTINGGAESGEGFWYTIGQIGGTIVKSIVTLAETAMDYQASLSTSDKK